MTRIDLPFDPADAVAAEACERTMLEHDTRAALNGVLGGLALIDRDRLDPSLAAQVDRIAASAHALAALVEAGLTGDLPDSAPGDRAVDLAEFRRSVARRWTGEAEAKGLRLRIEENGPQPANLLVDRLSLERTLANLLGTAIEFGTRGTVVFGLTRKGGGDLVLSVREEGPDRRGSERLPDSGTPGEPGLPAGRDTGLDIANRLATAIGGQLVAEDHAAGGIGARLVLPAALCAGTRPDAPEAEGALPDLGGRRILLAEDNPTNQMVASQMLAAMNAEVATAADGLDALALFEKEVFDLVLIDIEMPRLSGLEVIRTIRARSDSKARIPVVALTAYSMREHRLHIAEAGADGLISKPILSTREFGRSIAEHLRNRSTVLEAPRPQDEPQIDHAVFRDLTATIGSELMAELLDRIVIDLEAVRAGLEAALRTLDPAGIRTNSHILISVAGAFGASRLRNRASLLNAAAHAAEGDGLAAELQACLDEIPPAVAFAREQRARC